MSTAPIAYTYEADHHCPDCAEQRFGRSEAGFIAEEATDNEGNEVGAIFPWNEWWQDSSACETLFCSDCSGEIDIAHADPCTCDEGGDVEYSRCPACGSVIDYCRGHGEIGDPAGFAILTAHDEGDHSGCHPEGCDGQE